MPATNLRYTQLQDFKQCPLKYDLTWNKRLIKMEEEKGKESHDKDYGSAIHKGLETHYNGGTWEQVKDAFNKEYPKHLDPEDLAKTPENGIETLRRYIQYYSTEDKLWKVIGTEVKDTFEVEGIMFELHIDLVAEHAQSGIYLFDHKSSGSPKGIAWSDYDLNDQITEYTYYVNKRWGQCAGAVINGIELKYLLKKNKYGQGPGLVTTFERHIYNRKPEEIKNWIKGVASWKKRIDWSTEHNDFPYNYGKLCGWCDFRDLCLANMDESVKESLYTTKEKE